MRVSGARQVVAFRCAVWRVGCCGRILARHRCDKGVTSPDMVGYVALDATPIAERFVQHRHYGP